MSEGGVGGVGGAAAAGVGGGAAAGGAGSIGGAGAVTPAPSVGGDSGGESSGPSIGAISDGGSGSPTALPEMSTQDFCTLRTQAATPAEETPELDLNKMLKWLIAIKLLEAMSKDGG
jgi:hypothetical protein